MKLIILCGGKGTRLRSVVSNVPKPLAPVGKRVFLEILVDKFCDLGVTDITICSGYMHEKIERFIRQYDSRTIAIRNIVENQPLGTGGALINCFRALEAGKYLCINGDTYFDDMDRSDLVNFFDSSSELTAITTPVSESSNESRYGQFNISETGLIAPDRTVALTTKAISTGMYVFDRNSFCRLFPTIQHISVEGLVANALQKGEIVSNINFSKRFIDIGVPSDYFSFLKSHA